MTHILKRVITKGNFNILVTIMISIDDSVDNNKNYSNKCNKINRKNLSH